MFGNERHVVFVFRKRKRTSAMPVCEETEREEAGQVPNIEILMVVVHSIWQKQRFNRFQSLYYLTNYHSSL